MTLAFIERACSFLCCLHTLSHLLFCSVDLQSSVSSDKFNFKPIMLFFHLADRVQKALVLKIPIHLWACCRAFIVKTEISAFSRSLNQNHLVHHLQHKDNHLLCLYCSNCRKNYDRLSLLVENQRTQSLKDCCSD